MPKSEVVELKPATGTKAVVPAKRHCDTPRPVTNLVERDELVAAVEQYRPLLGNVVIEDDEQYEQYVEKLKDIARLDKAIEELFKPEKQWWHKGHKEISGEEGDLRDLLKKLKDFIGRVAGKYQADLENQRKIEREMLLEQQKAEMMASAQELAAGLEEAGDVEAAAGVLTQAEKLQPEVNCESIAPHVRGSAVITRWKFEVIDIEALPMEYKTIVVNEAKINAQVQAGKELTKIPGVRVYSETKTSARV